MLLSRRILTLFWDFTVDGSGLFYVRVEFKNAKCLNLCELQLILGDQLRLSVARPAEAHK